MCVIDQIRIAKSVEDRAGHNSNEREQIGNALQQNDINVSTFDCSIRIMLKIDDVDLYKLLFLKLFEISRNRSGLFT